MKIYIRLIATITLLLAAAYYYLKNHPEMKLSVEPGRTLSLYLGWAGIGLMLLMNLYSLRKRGLIFTDTKLSSWLDFHIFCGLMGPVFILFHCGFKVRGLVAVSFWSMIVSATSGIVGRYFYAQLLSKKKDLGDDITDWEARLKKMQIAVEPPVTDEAMERAKQAALLHVGAKDLSNTSILSAFFSSLTGDIRLFISDPRTLAALGPGSRILLREYALAKRRQHFLEPFRSLMGYWHTFHFPFAIFMYAAAVIHIAAALLFGVKR